MTTKTTAQQIADLLGNDGQRFTARDGSTVDLGGRPIDVSGRHLDELADDIFQGRQTWRVGDTYRWNFGDGSAIVVAGAAWDLALDSFDDLRVAEQYGLLAAIATRSWRKTRQARERRRREAARHARLAWRYAVLAERAQGLELP